MYSIFKLSLVTIIKERTGFFLVVLSAILPFFLPQLSNYEVNEAVLAPAKAQAAWQIAWFFGAFWLLLQGAKLGSEHAMSGMGAYFSSSGVDKGKQLTALWLSTVVFALALVIVPIILVLTTSMPKHDVSSSHMVVLCVQHFCFLLLVLLPLTLLSVSLASRFGVVIGYLIPLGLLFLGFYGVPVMGKIASVKDEYMLDVLYVVSPHYYLGDLTHRFVHMQGALTNKEFFTIFEYLAGWAMLCTGLSWLSFSPKQK